MKIEKCEYQGIKYLLYYPKNYEEGKKYPIFFHLHGAGSRGINFEGFKDSVILDILEKEDSPLSECICVFPQCHEDTWYSIFTPLIELTKHIYNSSFTDKSRFNGSGISMGGYGIYQLMMCLPELFNKAIVCCGGGMYWNASRMKNIKFRIFHGDNDPAVYVNEAQNMYKKLIECGAEASLTIYPNCEHNCWEKTYSNYENLSWLMK